MADINSIVQEQSYRGDANLGGGSSGVIAIDASPLENFARYKMFANKADYDQRQKDVDAKVADLAKLTALDLNLAIGKDKDELTKEFATLLEKDGREYATHVPTSQQDKLDRMLSFNDKLDKFQSKLTSATGRAISYNKQKEDLKASSFSPEERKRRQDILDKKFNDTDIFTPVSLMDNFSFNIPQIPKSPKIAFDVTEKGINGATTSTYGIIDGAKADTIASSLAIGFDVQPLPSNATEGEIEEYYQRQEAFKSGGATIYQQVADEYNLVVNDSKYKDQYGNLDLNKVKASNKLLADSIGLLEYMNNYNRNIESKFNAGAFLDKTGVNPAINFPDKTGYLQVDLTKPITAKDLIKAELYRNAESDIKKEDYKYTGEQNQLKIAANAQAGENYRKGLDLMEKGWTKDKKGNWIPPVAQTKGVQNLIDESAAFAKSVIDKIAAATDANGNVDLTKAQLTPIEWQQMGYGELDANTGKFKLTEQKPTALKFNKETQRVEIIKEGSKGGWFSKDTPASSQFIDYKQIANNKFHFSNAITAGKEGEERKEISTGYGSTTNTVAAPTEIPTVTSQAEFDKLKSGQEYIEDGVKYKKP